MPPEDGESLRLLVYQLGQLRSVTESGFDRIEARLQDTERRVSGVERWQASHDAVERERERREELARLREEASTSWREGWPKTAVLALAALGSALAIIASLVEKM